MAEDALRGLALLGWIAWHCPHCGTYQGYELPDGTLCFGFPFVTGGFIRMAKWDCVCGCSLYWSVRAKKRTNLKTRSTNS